MRVDRDSQVRRNVRQAHLSEGGAEAAEILESRSDWTERSDAIIQRGSAAYRGARITSRLFTGITSSWKRVQAEGQ